MKLTTLITNTFINELHTSLERNIANGHDTAPYTNQGVGITGIVPQETLPPAMVIIGAYNLGGTLSPYVGPANQIQIGDQISWSHGKHTIRAGFEYEWLQWNLSFASLLRGFLFSPSFNDFLIGRAGLRRSELLRKLHHGHYGCSLWHLVGMPLLRSQRAQRNYSRLPRARHERIRPG